MPSVTPAIVDCAPGNALSLTCSGLANGSANVVLLNQGAVNEQGLATGGLVSVIPATVSGSNLLAFTIPDGLCTGPAIASQASPQLVATVAGNTVTLSGSIQPGDVVYVSFGPFGANYEVQGGDTLASIAQALSNAINAPNIRNIKATVNGNAVTVNSPTSPTFGVTTTAGGAAVALRVGSQYVQASEYFGEGADTSALATGELDALLRRASSIIDTYTGGTMRQLQWLEQHKYRKSRKVFWFRGPAISVDGLVFVSANQIRTAFNVSNDVYVNASSGYVDILAYALGQYALLGSLEVIGFSANVIELTITSGYAQLYYPQNLGDACQIIATELLSSRTLQSIGMGPFDRIEDKLWRRKDSVSGDGSGYSIPQRAKDLLKPYRLIAIR